MNMRSSHLKFRPIIPKSLFMRTPVSLRLALTAAFHSQQGSSFITVLFFTTLIMVLLGSAWRIANFRQEKWQSEKIYHSRDAVLTSAMRNIRVATYFYYTLLQNDPVNADFLSCMIDDSGPPNDCQALDGSGNPVAHKVRLYDDTATVVIGEDADHPAYYDLYGEICTTPSENCPFNVYGFYTVICEGATVTCAQAYEIEVSVFLVPDPSLINSLPAMAKMSATQKISIANYTDSYLPVLPPTTPFGAPVTSGAGPGGWITNAMASSGSTTTTMPSGPTTTTTTIPSVVTPCGVGRGARSNGQCGTLNF